MSPMQRFIDLHCHYVPAIDDGAKTIEDSVLIVEGLAKIGFRKIVATPHMRPGLFDNSATAIINAFNAVAPTLKALPNCPEIAVSSEHYFDDVVYTRILAGQAVPYPGGHAILCEFYETDFPYSIDQRLADISRRGMTPVIAHPERYQPIAKNPEILERLLDVGAVALLDLMSVLGKYGKRAQRTAIALLERELYFAACSDTHRLEDVEKVEKSIAWLSAHFGEQAVTALLVEGPVSILEGT
jgi:protein-tyrosine phosphatase